jgi:hypothetical protein
MIGRYFVFENVPIKVISEFGTRINNKRYHLKNIQTDSKFEVPKETFIQSIRNGATVELKTEEELIIAKLG